MKNTLFLCLLATSFSALALPEPTCVDSSEECLTEEFTSLDFLDVEKRDFKKRSPQKKSLREIIRIETNFKAPFSGKDPYFGRIYLNTDPNKLSYRDELLAEKYYSVELNNPSLFYITNYKVSELNNGDGLSMIEGAGAEVNLKSVNGKFNSRTGGRLVLKVKHPISGTFSLNLNLIIKNGTVISSVEDDGKSYLFDSLKINAVGLGIAAGIKNLEFSRKGQISLKYTP